MSAAPLVSAQALDALSGAADGAASNAALAAPVAVPPAPTPATLEAFRSALAGAAPPPSITPTSATGAPSSAGIGSSTGDTGLASTPIGARIIDKLQGVSNSMDNNFRVADKALSSNINSMHEIMRVQMSLVSWSYQTELVTKAVAKASQDVDQLLKMQ
ncbi:type III secretion system inner rod subunit SctI [Paraburkholderia bonniea]|uniref:type III secretion system inner rod subunit SctI n=1 Tax=Paraburkholderia bonniea TaxID=2152891 RepID=UPI001292B9AE|nr:type III secretion system inner rod subunit SctI [Paraburkholderia bonniea]WJF89294.1 type III secretion system inner rod subunit SctI [Paraburkholderia bonniea]WJF92610.1 type III secretion system inner rod subunit SctI [Paraburkholderia bonniea]